MPRKVLTGASSEPWEDGSIQVEVMLPVRNCRREGGRRDQNDQASKPSTRPRMPRITRLMALAIKFQSIVDRGDVDDYADLARLGYVTRARVTQIMNLLNLAPDIQEQLLFADNDPVMNVHPFERQLRPILSVVDWPTQRRQMQETFRGTSSPDSARSTQT